MRIDAKKDYNCIWVVHPFLYSLQADVSKITIDWEHSEYQFGGTRAFLLFAA